ncbi:hypothetical protein ACJX0J_023420, partial [Zea mays]
HRIYSTFLLIQIVTQGIREQDRIANTGIEYIQSMQQIALNVLSWRATQLRKILRHT